MPNIGYDAKNPTDLLDRPIAVGDIVAWGTAYGRSPAVCVARIEKINFKRYIGRGQVSYYLSASDFIPCEQHEADKYTLTIQPLKSTGSTTIPTRYHSEGYWYDDDGKRHEGYFEALSDKPKSKVVQIVKNVVKLEPLA